MKFNKGEDMILKKILKGNPDFENKENIVRYAVRRYYDFLMN